MNRQDVEILLRNQITLITETMQSLSQLKTYYLLQLQRGNITQWGYDKALKWIESEEAKIIKANCKPKQEN